MADRTGKTIRVTDSARRFGQTRFVVRSWLPYRGFQTRLAVFLGWLLFCQTAGAENPSVNGGTALYHVAGEDAAIALREFSRQSGLQLVFPISAVRGVQTNPVEGLHTAADALNQLLAGTALEAVADAKTGAWAVRRIPLPAPKKKPRRTSPHTAETPDIPIEMDAFAVNTRHDAGIQSQSILRTDAEAPLYHQVITRKQIEASGVTSIAELMTMVAGYAGEGMENLQSSVNLALENGVSFGYRGAFLKLRGFDSTRNAVLLNGRRLPFSVDSQGPDLSRIPLAAIERVDVLPYSGSALYGENVIGGAVDIVLRKDYVGHSLSWLYGTTSRGGGNEAAMTAVEGTTLGDGRTKATLIFDYQHRSALHLGERDFLARAEAVQPLADIWQKLRSVNGTLNRTDRDYLNTASPSYPAVILSSYIGFPGLGIPGDERQTFASVPQGQDGTALTPSSFRPTASEGGVERREQRAILRRPNETYSFTAQVEHAFVPEKWEMYFEAGYSQDVDQFSSADDVAAAELSLFDPNNPFRKAVTPNFPGTTIDIFFDPVDLPDNNFHQVRRGARVVGGLKGTISERWSWTADSSFDHADTQTRIDAPNAPLNNLISQARSDETSDLLFKIYNPLADHRAYPLSPETIARYFKYRSTIRSKADVYGFNARFYGTPLTLPAGPLGLSVKSEYRREVNSGEMSLETSPELDRLLAVPPLILRPSSNHLDFVSLVGELTAPLMGPGWRTLSLDSVELNSATRASTIITGGIKFTQTQAIKIVPRKWIALRAAYSEGFLPPTAGVLHGQQSEEYLPWGLVDRSGAPLSPVQGRVLSGGNPALRAESSVSRTVGIILRPPLADGISLTADFWSIKAKNGIRNVLPQEILDNPDLFPGRVSRITDPITGTTLVRIDARGANVARDSSAGVDLAFNWHATSPRLGDLDFSSTATLVNSYEEQVLASSPPVSLLSRVGGNQRYGSASSPLLPARGRATLAWEKKNVRVGVTANYLSAYIVQAPGRGTNPYANQDFEKVSSSTLWDLQLNYVTSRASWGRGRTTLTLGVRNLFDRAPSYQTDGVAFYSHFEDPRMRFIYLRVQQEW